MIFCECGTWRIEWGPGSSRPGYFMLYHDDGREVVYLGTFLTALAAVREAERLDRHEMQDETAEIN